MQSMEAKPKDPESFIGNLPFGFTLERIKEEIEKTKKELEQINVKLLEENLEESFRKFIEGRKKHVEKFIATPAEEVIKNYQMIYNCILQQEKEKLSKKDIMKKIETEKPEFIQTIRSFPSIENERWGYRLHQDIIAWGFENMLKQK